MRFPLQALTNFNQWIQKIPTNALENAYQSAISIKAIEDQHFQGQMISPETEGGRSVYEYYKSALDRELAKINVNLTQLKISHFFDIGKRQITPQDSSSSEGLTETEIRDKLNFIEKVIGKYRQQEEEKLSALEKPLQPQNLPPNELKTIESIETNPSQDESNLLDNLETRLGRNPSNRRRRFSEEYEQEVIQELRQLREKRKITWRILPILVIVPLFVQIVTNNLIYTPIIDHFIADQVQVRKVRIAQEVGERSLEEYRRFKDLLEIENFLNPEGLSESEKLEKLQDKVKELYTQAGYETQEGLANILADITALLTFAGIVYFRQRQCRIAASFLSESFLGLSVVTQVFIFVLLTDMFVGFHSAEGWDVILRKTSEHLGFPESPAFNGLFIATIPVMLDSVFKLLIFNYFTRKSPAAVAILEKMNQ